MPWRIGLCTSYVHTVACWHVIDAVTTLPQTKQRAHHPTAAGCLQCGRKKHTSTLCPSYIPWTDWTDGPYACQVEAGPYCVQWVSSFHLKIIQSVLHTPEITSHWYTWFAIHILYSLLVLLCTILVYFCSLEDNKCRHGNAISTYIWYNCCVQQLLPTDCLEGSFTGYSNYRCRLWYIPNTAFICVPYVIWIILWAPHFQPLIVELGNLYGICCNGTGNQKVYSHLFVQFCFGLFL